ncbi:MAG TPA: homoserine dehydrogenase [Clostridia bacterium]|nr:homoserine dehydrogenase [Clostridia bacterium]
MKIALLGYGTVGSGAYDVLAAFPEIEVKRVLVRHACACGAFEMTADFSDILNDPEISLVAEVMGGTEPARSYVLSAIKAGKHAVSANKELICLSYQELYSAAAKNGVCLRHTACAGGGIQWLYNLERAMRCDDIMEIGGIMNGTSNYILDAMQKGMDFDAALKQAQALGYAEADPSADIDGLDAARKCAVSANMAFQTAVRESEMDVAGIRFAERGDIEFGIERKMVLKLKVRAARAQNAVSAYAEPCFVSVASQEAHVPDNYNLLSFVGKRLKKQSFFGQGAGKLPTGVTVAQDILDIARGLVRPPENGFRPLSVNNETAVHRYYVRSCAEASHEALIGLACEQILMGKCRAYITKPVSVHAMHALAKNLREADPRLFFAGMD